MGNFDNFDLARVYADAPVAHDDGRFINAKVSRVVELIRQYDSRLDVRWIPPDKRLEGDPAFVITEKLSDGREMPVFHVDSEEHMNEEVLAVIYRGDTNKHDVMADIEAKNAAYRNVNALRERDTMEARHDLMRSILKSPKHNYQHNGKTFRK